MPSSGCLTRTFFDCEKNYASKKNLSGVDVKGKSQKQQSRMIFFSCIEPGAINIHNLLLLIIFHPTKSGALLSSVYKTQKKDELFSI